MRISTGIPGFDALIDGGFEEGTTNLIAGEAGTCKTIFCLQFLYNRAVKHNENVMYITTEDGVDNVYKQAEKFGWDIHRPPINKKFKILELEPYNMNALMKVVDEINRKRVTRLVIDSMSVFEIYVKEPFIIRKSLFNIISRLRACNAITIMTTEIPFGSNGMSRSNIMEFMADSVIRMQFIQEASTKRSVIIKKMRFSNHAENAHPFRITKNGIVVSK